MERLYLCGWQLYSPQWGTIHHLLLNKQYLMKAWLHSDIEARFNHWSQNTNSTLTANSSQPTVTVIAKVMLFLYMPWKHMEGRRCIVPLISDLSTSRRWGDSYTHTHTHTHQWFYPYRKSPRTSLDTVEKRNISPAPGRNWTIAPWSSSLYPCHYTDNDTPAYEVYRCYEIKSVSNCR